MLNCFALQFTYESVCFFTFFANSIVKVYDVANWLDEKYYVHLILFCFSLLYVRWNIFSFFFSFFCELPDLALCPFLLGFWKFSYQFLILFLKDIKEIGPFFWFFLICLIRHYSFYPCNNSSLSVLFHPPFNWWRNLSKGRLSNLPKVTRCVEGRVGTRCLLSLLVFLMVLLWIVSLG